MLLRLDGNDHYDTTYFPKKYTTVDSTRVTWTRTTNGPGGKGCVERTNTASGESGYLETSPLMTQSAAWTPTTSGVFGFKVWINAISKISNPTGAGNPTNALVEILTGGNPHLSLQLNPNGTFTLVRAGAFGTTLGTSAEGLRDSEWATVEIKWTIDATVGSVTVVVNRVAVLTVSGINTKSGSVVESTWNSVIFGRPAADASGATTLNIRLADWYLADQTGGANDVKDFLLSWNFATIVSNGVGAVNAWTPSAGANWENVDEIPPDGDTTYNLTTAVADADSFAFQNLPAGAVVLGYQVVALPRLTAAGVAGIKPRIRIAAVNYDGLEQGITQTTYDTFRMWPYDTSPATGVKATEAEINAAEFGYVKSA